MADGPAPEPPNPNRTNASRRTSPLLTASLVAAGALGAIALASRRSGLFGAVSDGTAPFGKVAVRAAIGALGGLVVAAVVLTVLRATNRRHRLIEDSPARPNWRYVLAWSVPIVLLLAALGAAAGSATTPLQPRTATIDENGGGGNGRARLVDRNKDGKADLDANGNPILAYDVDGDGRYDTTLRTCPDDVGYNGVTRTPHEAAVPRGRAPIDANCDGKIDYWVPVDERLLTLAPVDQGPLPQGTSSQPRVPNFSDALRSLGWIIAVIAVIGGLYALYSFLTRRRGSPSDEPAPAAAAGDVDVDEIGVDLAMAAATLDDSIEAMLADADPRTAVRAAYARLLDGLAAAGLPRAPYEAPDEHLTRCLRSIEVQPDPMRDLVDVFVLARFSDHPVTEAHRAIALAALRDAQNALADALTGVGSDGA